MQLPRTVRYMVPNVITLSSMIFGLVSLWASHQGNWSLAAWMVIYAVLTDRIDGITARALNATSEIGMQLDSFADFFNFGIAPAYLILTYIPTRVAWYQDGVGKYLLFAACGLYMLCAVFRLARYNVISDNDVPTRIFFGFPTTLTGGSLAIWMLLFLKYDPTYADFGGSKLFGELSTPVAVWKYLPIAFVIGGYLMASRLPMPKMGMTKSRVVGRTLFVLISTGYVCGFLMVYPEIIFWMPTVWSVYFLAWGQLSAKARAMQAPPLFPATDRKLERPQEDLEDLVLDESSGIRAPGDQKAAP